MIFDSHCHLNDPQFKKDLEEVLSRAKSFGVEKILIPGYDLPSSIKAVELAEKYNLYASCGLHPHDAKKFTPATLKEIERLEKSSSKVVAIGEIGLDFYKNYSPQEVQKEVFTQFLQLAESLKKPVILHVRNAYKEVFDIIEDFSLVSVIFHCFSGGPQEAEIILQRENYYISFSGTITYKNDALIRVAKLVPPEKILIETDAPYLTPSLEKGRNEPAYVRHVLKKISDIKKIDYEELAKITYENTIKAFGISENS
uniref:TatD family deoxyribonuclease n=1 Tax=candidate division WOR-3 bacterium TaxID=2052148 RepID=A0A7V3NVJ2_UNCW3